MRAEDQIDRYKMLLSTARCLGRAMDLRTLIDDILARSREVMRAEACTLLLPDERTNDLLLHSTDSRVTTFQEPLRVPAGQGLAGTVFRTRQTLNLEDAQKDPRHYQGIGKQVGSITRAIISIPLLEGERCLGVLQAINPVDRPAFDAQDAEIFEGFGGLIVNALLRLEAQKREVERAQTRQELLLAREIQNSFLPAGPQLFPFGQVHFHYSPAQTVGGDFYFVHAAPGDRLLAGLADVSGKGVPAALTMARVTAILRVHSARLDQDLGEWVTALNRQLATELKAGRFIGMTLLLADAQSSKLQICAAGQFAPAHREGEAWKQAEVRNHLPLGILESARYEATEVDLQRGDCWLLFSDGITEARNAANQEFTVTGFLKGLPAGRTAAHTLSAGISGWKSFVGSAAQHDDASLLLLDWRGLVPSAELDLSCCPENLALGRGFTEAWAQYAGYDDITVGQIVMACDEAVSNIFRHAYQGKSGPLRYEAELANESLIIRIRDEGEPIDSARIKSRDLTDLRPGGLGTFIMTQVFDDVRYEPREVGTVLTLRKRLVGDSN